MNFLYPAFLFGLFALAIPIIVHLFNFRKTKKIYFSNNKFLKNIKDANSPKYKLKHFLILSSRMLFLAFMVFAFAQPFIPGESENSFNKTVLIYLDNSYSMINETVNGTPAFDLGANYVNEIINLYPEGTKFKLLTNDFAPFSNLYKSKNDIRDFLTELSYSGVARSFAEVNSRISKEKFSLKGEPADIFWISDFQKSTTGELENWDTDTLNSNFFVPVNFQSQSNVYVDTLYLTTPFLMTNETNEIEAVLQNTGKEDVEDLIVKLFINEAQVSSASTTIKANGKSTIKFELNTKLEKFNKGKLSFEDFPVSFDNEFYFNLNLGDRVKITEIKSAEADKSIANVFANEKLFQFRTYNAANIDYSAINTSDLIILNQINSIDATLIPFLKDFGRAGGNIVLIPGEKADVLTYNNLLGGNMISKEDGSINVKLSTPDLKNPFFKDVFVEAEKNFDMPEAKRIISWKGRGTNLLQVRTGEPFLTEISSIGNFYLIGSPLHEKYTTFQKHAIFVPVMYKIAGRSKKLGENLYENLNESVLRLTVDSLAPNNIYKMVNDGKELIPAQRVSEKDLFLELPKHTLNNGFYDLMLNESLQKVIAFNMDKKESILDQYYTDDLERIFKGAENIKVYDTKDANAFTASMKAKHMGVSLWKYALILALIFLFAEVLLVRFFKS
jgi:hypothetical protein